MRLVLAFLLLSLAACGDGSDDGSPPANETVRARIAALAPAANLAHRGQGPTRPRGALPENSLAAFRAAMAQGADGVELDVELTRDGQLVVMHDDGFDRTTTCRGCANDFTLAEARRCALLDGAKQPTDQVPPMLAEVYDAIGPDALVNVEMKVFGPACRTADSGPEVLARTTAAEIRRLGVARRTLVSSFDEAALVELRRVDAGLYAALLYGALQPGVVDHVAALGFDAIHPFWSGVDAAETARARSLGLQVNLWTVNTEPFLRQSLAKRPTAIITDEPGVLRSVLDSTP
ncbi:MAG: glycerophosphodiester phosphodiesterase family protein [Deltaproteobacteria bacterium]|nr:glycerophosphodiester phosphodiesterase family protein [Deltaproteobacteria bacterium]